MWKSRSVRVAILGVLAVAVATSALLAAGRLHLARLHRLLASVNIPLPPDAQDVTDAIGNRTRRIQYRVSATYPSLSVLEFYVSTLPALGWTPRNGADGAETWIAAQWGDRKRSGSDNQPRPKSHGVMRLYWKEWQHPESGLWLKLLVRDYSLVEESQRPAWAKGGMPGQAVTLNLLRKPDPDVGGMGGKP